MLGHIEIISKRYGDGYIGFAKKYMSLDKIHKEAIDLKNILKKETDFLKILESSIDEKEKNILINRTLKKFFSDEIIIFLKFLITKNKIKYVLPILDYIRNDFKNNNKNVIITSLYPLDLDIIKKIKTLLEKKINGNINIAFDFDPHLIAGIKIYIENKVFDCSIASKILALKSFLKKNSKY